MSALVAARGWLDRSLTFVRDDKSIRRAVWLASVLLFVIWLMADARFAGFGFVVLELGFIGWIGSADAGFVGFGFFIGSPSQVPLGSAWALLQCVRRVRCCGSILRTLFILVQRKGS